MCFRSILHQLRNAQNLYSSQLFSGYYLFSYKCTLLNDFQFFQCFKPYVIHISLRANVLLYRCSSTSDQRWSSSSTLHVLRTLPQTCWRAAWELLPTATAQVQDTVPQGTSETTQTPSMVSTKAEGFHTSQSQKIVSETIINWGPFPLF